MKFVKLEIKDGVKEDNTYTLPELIKSMDSEFYEKWDQHLDNTTLSPLELYEKNYRLEFKEYVTLYDTIYKYLYLIDKNKNIIGELKLLFLDRNSFVDKSNIPCSFCRNSEEIYEASGIYNAFNEIDSKKFPLKFHWWYEGDCWECDKGKIKTPNYESVPNDLNERDDYVYVQKITYYDKFEYFKNGKLLLGEE